MPREEAGEEYGEQKLMEDALNCLELAEIYAGRAQFLLRLLKARLKHDTP